MAAYTKTLYDSTGTNILYPQTLAQIVYTQDNQNVESVLQTKLTTPSGTQGQVLGYTADNVVGAINPPSSSSMYNTTYTGVLQSGSSAWTSSSGMYYQQFSLDTITSTQTPLVFPQWTTNKSNEQTSWNMLTDIQSFDGYIRFYANQPTTTNVNFIIVYSTLDRSLIELIKAGTSTYGTFNPA